MIRIAPRFAGAAGVAALLAAGMAAPAAAADGPTLLGAFKDWSAYYDRHRRLQDLLRPVPAQEHEPKNVNRDPVFFLVSDWPARKAKGEPEVVPGYPYKDGSKVTAQVGSDKFTFFTKNDGKDGNAWVEAKADEARLVDAMRRGSQMIVTGTSSRGTLTKDTYSLSGISAALDKIHAACGM